MAVRARYPASELVPAPSALLALLALKLLDKERRSQSNDFDFDEALGLFAGLNVLPKKSFATDYSFGQEQEFSSAGSGPVFLTQDRQMANRTYRMPNLYGGCC